MYNGTSWSAASFSEITLSLAGLLSNTNYDIFVYDNAGSATLEAVAWTDNITRTTSLTTQDGIYVKSGDSTRRYVGTIRTTSVAGQTEDSSGGANTIGRRFIWNYTNRIKTTFLIHETTFSWSYSTGVWRRMNNNTNMKAEFIIGINEPTIEFYGVFSMNSSSTPVAGIGLDWTTGDPSNVLYSFGAAGGAYGTVVIPLITKPGEGYHDVSALEKGNTGATFYGLNNGGWKCGITGAFES